MDDESAQILRLPGGIIPEGLAPNRDVLTYLDELKEMALRGDISSIAVAWCNPQGRSDYGWSVSSERLKLLGACTVLVNQLAANLE